MNILRPAFIRVLCACALAAAAGSDAIAVQKTGYQPRTARGALAGEFVRKWAGHVQRTYGTPPTAWARSMGRTFAEADVRNMQRAAAMTTYEDAMDVMLGARSSGAPVATQRASANTTSISALAAANPVAELVYTPVRPCRILDTRNALGRFRPGEERGVFVHNSTFIAQGGANEACGIPKDPSAVVLNVVAVGPADNGFLSVYPYGAARAASSLNYVAGSIVANELIIKTTAGEPYDLALYSQAETDVVVDIAGYFTTKVNGFRTVLRKEGRVLTVPAGETDFVASGCLPGEVAVGGTPTNRPSNLSYLYQNRSISYGSSTDDLRSGWSVSYRNDGVVPVQVYAETGALCATGTLTLAN